MAQALDTLEALLVYSGGGLPGRTDKAPSERHGLRYLMEVTLGQFVGVLVAIWCILRSIDSVFEVPGQPAYPGAGSGGYVPGAAERAVKPGMEASGPGAAVAMGARRRGSVSSNGSSAAAKPADELPGSAAFACKVVNIRSKRSLQTIARLSRSGSEVRRRLIEFSFQTRAWPLAAHSSDKNAANVAASPLPVPQGAVVGVVARRQGECEELLRLVVRGAIPADASAKLASKRLLDPPQESSAAGGAAEQAAAAWEATRPPGSSSRSSGGGAAGLSAAEPISPASLIHKAPQPEPAGTPPSLGQREGLATPGGIAPARAARKSYLGFTSSGRTDAAAGPAGGSGGSNSSAGSGVGGGLDLSAEMAFVTGAEAVLNGLLDAAAQRGKHPHPSLCSFLSLPPAASASASPVVTAGAADGLVGDGAAGAPRLTNLASASEDSDSEEDDYNSEDDEKMAREAAAAAAKAATAGGGSASGLGAAGASGGGAGDDGNKKLPPKAEWPDYPILVRCSEDVPMTIDLPGVSAYGALPINHAAQPIPFETNLFKGVAMIRIADIRTTDHSYFDGKRRKMQVCVQGKFKKPLRFDQVFGGQEFSGGLRNIPGKWMIKWAFELLKPGLPKSFKADLFGPSPYFLSPLVLTAQKMRADHPDDGPPQPVSDHDIQEEMGHLLGPEYRGKNNDKGRKKAFGGANALASAYFDPNVTYTFDYFQQFLRSDQFALDLGVKLLDLNHYLGHQPILLTMAKTMDTGEYLWKFELWHERCVPGDTSRPPDL